MFNSSGVCLSRFIFDFVLHIHVSLPNTEYLSSFSTYVIFPVLVDMPSVG